MFRTDSLRLDLGFRKLWPDWRALFSVRHLRDDLLAGLSVSLIAVPLSLAIALASNVPPAVGLVTAVVAGIAAGLLGGAPLSVTGPAAAMAVLIASLIDRHGIHGLIAITLGAGALQVITGVLGLGRIARLVPTPVIEGFTAGIGAIILVGQLPRALGLAPPKDSHVLEVITHIGTLLHEAQPTSIAIAVSTMAIVMVSPKLHPRMPGPLLGVLIPSVAVTWLGIDTGLVGAVPNTLPRPSWPSGVIDWPGLVGPTFIVYALASLESLLSAAAVDKLAKGPRHDPDQEFIGQGVGNMMSALFGGIPVTGVIARSALNVQAGGRTRRSAIIHSILVATGVLVLSPWLARIPLAALAGLLLSVAIRMLSPAHVLSLFKASKSDAFVYAVTFAVIVFVDLLEGVQWGIAAALMVAAIWSTRTHAQLHGLVAGGAHRLTLEGPYTFLSALKFDAVQNEIDLLPKGSSVVLDVSRVPYVDASGAERIIQIVDTLVGRQLETLVLGMNPTLEQRLLSFDHNGLIPPRIARSEADIVKISADLTSTGRDRLTLGVESYRRLQRPRYTELFKQLEEKQTPHTLFITCSDSRIVPTLITASDPGELFIVRNVGNLIPPNGDSRASMSGSAVEYAVGVLGVRDVVVCGHSGCGAVRAMRDPSGLPRELTQLQVWLEKSATHQLCRTLPSSMADEDLGRMNALLQIDHLRSHPIVRVREEAKELRLHAWFFHVGTGELEEFDPVTKTWRRELVPDVGRTGEKDGVLPRV